MKDRFHKDHKYTVNRYRALANAAARGEEDGSNFEAQVAKALTARGNVVKKPEAAPAPAAAPSGEGRIPEIRAELAKAPYGSGASYAEAQRGVQPALPGKRGMSDDEKHFRSRVAAEPKPKPVGILIGEIHSHQSRGRLSGRSGRSSTPQATGERWSEMAANILVPVVDGNVQGALQNLKKGMITRGILKEIRARVLREALNEAAPQGG